MEINLRNPNSNQFSEYCLIFCFFVRSFFKYFAFTNVSGSFVTTHFMSWRRLKEAVASLFRQLIFSIFPFFARPFISLSFFFSIGGFNRFLNFCYRFFSFFFYQCFFFFFLFLNLFLTKPAEHSRKPEKLKITFIKSGNKKENNIRYFFYQFSFAEVGFFDVSAASDFKHLFSRLFFICLFLRLVSALKHPKRFYPPRKN